MTDSFHWGLGAGACWHSSWFEVVSKMNSIQARIQDHLEAFPPELAAMKDSCAKYLRFCCAIDSDDTMMIAHRPWEAPENYLISLYPGAKSSWFGKYRQLNAVAIPAALQPLLSVTNGCFAFGISLYGMPPSMLKNPPVLDRSRLQCHDLSLANNSWKLSYKTDPNHFHFGSRHYSDTQNAGYFLVGKHQVVSILPGGKLVGEWSGLSSFLKAELAASEKLECSEIPDDWWH